MRNVLTPMFVLGMLGSAGGCNSGTSSDGSSSTAGLTTSAGASESPSQGSDSSDSAGLSGDTTPTTTTTTTATAASTDDTAATTSDPSTSAGSATTATGATDGDSTTSGVGTTSDGSTTTGDTTEGSTTGDDTGDDTGDLPDFVAECDDDPANPVIVTVMPNVTARFPSITAGLAAASDGSVIEVCPGTYSDKIEVKHDITLRGAGADKTIIDGGGFHFNLGDGEAVVEGFGFTHCNAKIPSGWNIASSGAISVSDTYGAQETLTVRDCRFFENSAEYGAAIHVSGSNNGGKNPDIIIEGSVFEKNVATGEGGAIASYGRVHISDSVFVANKARTGGALALSYGCTGPSVCDITHTVIMKNHTTGNSKYEGGGGIFIDSCGVNCLGGLTVTDSDLGFGASEENTDHQGLPEDVLINDGTDPWSRYGWYYNNVSFVCSVGVCAMP
jgi:predicted outer membrane repeat protein